MHVPNFGGFLGPLFLILLTLAACGGGGNSDESAQIFAPLGEPLPSATADELATFARGLAVTRRHFTPADGLGPEFNLVSCGGCHEKPVTGGSGPRYRDFLLVRALLPDGSAIDLGTNGVQPQFTLASGGYRGTDVGANLEANRNPMPFFGTGLLAEIPESEILKRVDENDADGDGISGRANFDRGFVGRFGRKAQTVSIEGFIRGPLFNHLGITSDPLPESRKARLPVPSAFLAATPSDSRNPHRAVQNAQVAAPDEPFFDEDDAPDPELSEDDLFDLVAFVMLTAAPLPDTPTVQTRRGESRFHDIGCANCHVPALQGPRGPVPAYSDLLLHDMGDELADGIEMGIATGSEFRTQPLWGIASAAPYLHDGRADTIDEAIRLHGGEAQAARDAYVDLIDADRAAVLSFLESLGGRAQRSAGLLPPDAPLPPPGMLGGPATDLSADEAARFARGRFLFDRDFGIRDGLGPAFNGDSCRACHFLPVIGGAGPVDVDVIRHGHLQDGVFTAPTQGTMAHRHSIAGVRPPIDRTANVFETRQTPPLFGLGFLDAIPESEILRNSKCNHPDPEEIAGCAHTLADGRLGRFGWKADVPSLTEFARDALFNELGITLPEIDGQTFGASNDLDAIADPEISRRDLDDLVFFMQQLAPPPRVRRDSAREVAGEEVFNEIGCAHCHIDDFVSPGGVVAYTDLLLHRVAPANSPGIASGNAGPLDFRTPPLWGLSQTAPYMHDGRSFTIEEAILAHDGTATATRRSYEQLDASARENLLIFLGSL